MLKDKNPKVLKLLENIIYFKRIPLKNATIIQKDNKQYVFVENNYSYIFNKREDAIDFLATLPDSILITDKIKTIKEAKEYLPKEILDMVNSKS